MKPFDRMQLASLGMVNRIADARASLLHKISIIETIQEAPILGTPAFCITIDGVRLSEELLALARPVLVRELRAQVAQLDRDLEALGVQVG